MGFSHLLHFACLRQVEQGSAVSFPGFCPHESRLLWCVSNTARKCKKPQGETAAVPNPTVQPVWRALAHWSPTERTSVWIPLQEWAHGPIKATLLLLAAAPQGVDRMVGGYECSPHSQPWQVVSAAHCWYYPDSKQVILGDHNIQVFEHTEHLMRIETIVWHPSYDYQTLDHNIMLIKLAHPVQTDAYVQPVALLTACPAASTSCVVSGWGNILSDGSDPYNLQCINIPILSNAQCEGFYPRMITSTMLCAGYLEGGKDACQVRANDHDSDGPLVCNGELQGIVSWGIGCAQKDQPGVYTKVCSLLPWIESTMAAN
uniref:Peptidase S1 domain-containing protein n=1 Tax=Gopherus evgoodei TaxID=1825980 RepID=A0A8C4WMT7_9SAUR